jgi:hypothetical protein
MNDQTVLLFTDSGSLKYNLKYDARKIMNTDPVIPSIYSVVDNMNFAIKAMPPDIYDGMIIPIRFKAYSSRVYTINASELSDFGPDVKVYLVDTKTQTTRDLTVNPSYTFSADENDGGRFYLKFSLISTGAGDNGEAGFCSIYESSGILFVNYNEPSGQKAVMSLYDIEGRKAQQDEAVNVGVTNYKTRVAPGAYFVKVVSPGKVYIKKILINNF